MIERLFVVKPLVITPLNERTLRVKILDVRILKENFIENISPKKKPACNIPKHKTPAYNIPTHVTIYISKTLFKETWFKGPWKKDLAFKTPG